MICDGVHCVSSKMRKHTEIFKGNFLLIILLTSCCLVQNSYSEERQKRQASPAEQPRIVTTDGHLVFQTGANHNISFQSSAGGSVVIDGKDMKHLSSQIDQHESRLQQLNGIEDQVSSAISTANNVQSALRSNMTRVSQQILSANRRITRTRNLTIDVSNDIRFMTRRLNFTRKFGRLKSKVNRLQSTVNTMQTKLRFDNCDSGPCQHGGTCVDMYDSYRCFCPPTWQGTNCEVDINECSIYAGTAQGCHSGSTCHNTNGGFSCLCPQGWTGVLCNVKAGRCSQGSDSEICGHGSCVDSGNTHLCVCDDGWTKDSATPARCTVDVDECSQVDKPCHDDVQCINVPGAYFCGHCPRGYTGNGHQCNDIDECQVLNGGCSLEPRVDCINTPGSRTCGPCPAGYEKTANEICIRINVCNTNNGGCSPHATCIDNPALPQRVCQCNPGYTGTGEGPNGCQSVNATEPCSPNPCAHGNCFNAPGSLAYTCSCFEGWTGHNCNQDINECDNNVCKNGGNCTNTPGNYTCTCPEYFRGRNCDTPTYECGGPLRGTTGSFQFPPNIHERYPHNVSCAWRITTTLNKILMVTFTKFQLESHSQCNYDFLQIHDGSTASAEQIGKYCGNDTERGLQGKTINSTHNQMYLWFKADTSINAQGFAFNWVSADPVCGEDIRNETHGTIASPGYPGNYPTNRTCVWTIRVPAGNNIKITFTEVKLEHHANCSYDYLEFRSGLLETDPVIQRFCTESQPPPLNSSGNELYIKFHSDASLSDKGFQFNWHTESAGRDCGANYNQSDGILISPNYPNNYGPNKDCVWTITVPQNQRISLNFTDIGMEHSTTCSFDYLQIHDGPDDTSPMYGRYCGTTLPAIITSTGNQLYARFHSDASVFGIGFRALWTVACGGIFTNPTGELVSPYWPENYPHSKTCYYSINAPEGQVIKVTFESFDIESDADGEEDTDCEYDSLIAYDGASELSPSLRKMCGGSVPNPVISTGNHMFLKFTSDGSVSDRGFKATYEFRETESPEEPSACGGILTNATGTIVSPGHPNYYPHGVDCLWEIRVSPGFQVRLTFNVFSLEQTEACTYDFVQIANNNNNLNNSVNPELVKPKPNVTVNPKDVFFNESHPGVYDGRHCGTKPPPVFTSVDNVLYVRFKADSSVAHEGFSASYVSFNHSWCGDERRTLPGVITSPDYPSNYPHQRECIWTIVAPDNHQIILNVTDFLMERHSACSYDYLEIRNGGTALSPLVGKFCGNNITTPIVSQSNRLWIKFKSDGSDSARGFRIWYEDAGEGCGADLTGPSGVFYSPNYPQVYGRNAECYWTITVSQGSSILVVFADLDIESHSTCDYDYVEVIEGLHSGRSLAKVCGTDLPHPIESQSNKVTVKFRSDHSMTGRGFHISYHAACRDRELTDWDGVIESPNFPNPYLHESNCSWVIRAGNGNILSVAFSHMNIEAHPSCFFDYVEIRDGDTPSGTLIGRYCGTNLPPRLNSTTNALYVKFVSDASVARNGFRLEYNTIGCGGDLTSSTGSFSSPNYPNSYPHNRECVWRITVPTGKKIRLNLVNVDLEFHKDCTYDVLEVRAGSDSTSPILTKICQNRNDSHIVTSTGNQMYVRFKSDTSSGGSGFFANYTSVDGGCGGLFTAPTGNIYSPNNPNTYPHSTSCEWNITVQELQTVQLTFKEFDVENSTSCVYDYVIVYDGLEADARELARLCGNITNQMVYTSSSNSMRIKMRTDESSAGRGFAATYVTACGGRINVGNDIGVIRSPHYPSNYDPSTNCTWTLYGSQAVDRITLQFTAMDIEESSSTTEICSHDSVKVLQGDNADAPLYGTYCGNTIPASITSTSYALTVVFHSDFSVQRTGFSASYSKSTSFCGGNITATHGAFSTPNYPNNYPRDVECIWYLNASPGNQMQITFTNFDLELSDGCTSDYVEVRELGNLNNVLGRFCGNSIPNNLTLAKSLYVKFRSDLENDNTGFMAQFATISGGDLTGNTGQLASPLYPRDYSNTQHTEWNIIVEQGKKVRIQFTDLDIEGHSACQYDYIQFLDGPKSSSPQEIARFCGTNIPPPFTSTGNVMSVVFHTDVSSAGRGFLFSWSAVDQVITTPNNSITTTPSTGGCNFELVATDDEQNVTSPGWPESYQNNMDCTWTIRSPNGERILFTLKEANIEFSSSCAYDKLTVYDGEAALLSRILSTICGRVTTERQLVSRGGTMTLKFTSDVSVTRTGFFGTFKKTCGGELSGPSGEISSPNLPSMYPINSNCSWLITVLNGRTIELNVETFNLPTSGNCTGDRLRILNGNNPLAPSIENGKWSYCGSEIPGSNGQSFESASRYMWIEFISDNQTDDSNSGFKLTYTEKSVACGGNLVIPDDDNFVGWFTSPGFGEDGYHHNADCTWIITAPQNARIQLDFPVFDIENHVSCNYDYLLIRDGGTENSRELARYCGKEKKPTVRSTNNVMRVRLVSDDSVAKDGFNITYQKEKCGGTIVASTGHIQSPQYPSNYPNGISCEWFIQVPTGHYIQLNFTTFNLGSSQLSNCSGQDTLSFYNRDVNGNVSTRIGQYCGNQAPVAPRSADSRAYIKFESNTATSFSGFKLDFVAGVDVCGGDLTTPTGVITSPNYPNQYPHSRQCRWRITAPLGKKITLTLADVKIESQSSCLFDYLEIHNGYLEKSPRLARVCGNVTDHVIKSTSNTMLVTFASDGSVSNGGFRITYTTNEDADCGGLLPNTPGAVSHIVSPGYVESIDSSGILQLTGQYPNKSQCIWKIQGSNPVNTSIVMVMESERFKLEHDGECRYDFLQIREGVNEEGNIVGQYCSNFTDNVPPKIAIPGDQLWLAFVSDSSVSHEGFNISYQIAPCGGVLRGDSGVITSPNWPNRYSNDMGCAWDIIAEPGSQITLFIESFDLEVSDKCLYDYLVIYNGPSHTSPQLAKICQNKAGTNYTSASNRVRLEFIADYSQPGNGFKIRYATTQSGCGGVFNDRNGGITTPNYPSNYPHNIECIWDINVLEGYHIILQTNGIFDVASGSSSCISDYVEFYNVNANGEATIINERYCGNVAPPVIKSNENHLRVKLRTDTQTSGTGFNMTWTSGCGGIYTEESGVFSSPGYPNNYDSNLTCDYILVADPSQFVVLSFDEQNFKIERGSTCQYDSVTIYNYNTSGSSLGSFCGLTAPQPLATRGQMLVRFKTDADTTDKGFRAQWVRSDCGGFFNNSYGEIKSPTHPVDYHHNLNCSWHIQVSANMSVKLKFEEFDLESSSNGNCTYDYLAIYDGEDINSPLIGRYCGNVLPEIVKSKSRFMTIQFRTDASIAKGGFRAIYTESYGELQGCGGMINGSSGTIVPVQKEGSSDYANELDCVWIVTVPDDKVISVQVGSVEIEDGESCDYDGLELIDGFDSTHPPLTTTICGTRSRTVSYTTSTNMLRVRFYSDGSIGGAGFILNYTAVNAVCGGILTASNTSAVIQSPNYPTRPDTIPLNCRWTIGSPNGKKIRITVTDLSIPSVDRCDNNFLQLRDQPLATSSGQGQDLRICGSTLPHSFDSQGSEAQVNFKYSGGGSSYKGFSLTYSIATCDREFTALNGRITSPGWPQSYPVSQDCWMNITVAAGNKIALYFNTFAMEHHDNCNYDYLEVFNGDVNNTLGKYCGPISSQEIISSSNSLLLRLKTDASVSMDGFDLTYVASPSGCGGRLTALSGGINKKNISSATTCEWQIEVPNRRVPTLKFDVLDLQQETEACPNAYIEVRDGNSSTSPIMEKVCNNQAPQITGTSNKLYIKFFTNSTLPAGASFKLSYTSDEPERTTRESRFRNLRRSFPTVLG